MKKILGIIVLAIVLQSCASSTTSRNTQVDLVKKGEIKYLESIKKKYNLN